MVCPGWSLGSRAKRYARFTAPGSATSLYTTVAACVNATCPCLQQTYGNLSGQGSVEAGDSSGDFYRIVIAPDGKTAEVTCSVTHALKTEEDIKPRRFGTVSHDPQKRFACQQP